MAFDFKALEKTSTRAPVIEAICFGAGGGGKSVLAGTLGGKILYLYGGGETHGPDQAKMFCDGTIVPLRIDTYENPEKNPDIALKTVQAVLEDREGIKKAGFTGVVLDSATEVEALIRGSKAYLKKCITKDGGHNAFAEPRAVTELFRPILSALRDLADEGVHYVVTCALDVKTLDDESGGLLECIPKLSTYSVAETIVLQFPDVLAIGPMIHPKTGEKQHRLQFNADVTKVSKDASGNIKKFVNFNPRICGVVKTQAHMKADLKEVLKLKKEAKK